MKFKVPNAVVAVATGSICNAMERILKHQNLDPVDLKVKMTTKWSVRWCNNQQDS
jgi:hypothetical protein